MLILSFGEVSETKMVRDTSVISRTRARTRTRAHTRRRTRRFKHTGAHGHAHEYTPSHAKRTQKHTYVHAHKYAHTDTRTCTRSQIYTHRRTQTSTWRYKYTYYMAHTKTHKRVRRLKIIKNNNNCVFLTGLHSGHVFGPVLVWATPCFWLSWPNDQPWRGSGRKILASWHLLRQRYWHKDTSYDLFKQESLGQLDWWICYAQCQVCSSDSRERYVVYLKAWYTTY